MMASELEFLPLDILSRRFNMTIDTARGRIEQNNRLRAGRVRSQLDADEIGGRVWSVDDFRNWCRDTMKSSMARKS